MKLRTPRRPFLFFEKSVYGKGARVYIFRKMSPKYTRNNDFTEKTAQNAASGVYCEKKSSELHPITRLPDANVYFGRFLLSGSWPGASGNDAAGLADNISMANGQTT